MKVVIATDAWSPQVNGVVTTYSNVIRILNTLGHQVQVIHPGLFRNLPCPFYKQIPLALFPFERIRRIINEERPHCVHIATEGPIGIATRRFCARNGIPFTTSYHTKFPDYIHRYTRLPRSIGYYWVRWFHRRSKRVMAPTQGVVDELTQRRFKNLVVWSRGVDTNIFRPGPKRLFSDLPRPISLYCGRVSAEKSIEDFLELDLPGSKVVVGDGPALGALKERFPQVTWCGFLHGEALAERYRSADVFVFPSRTDTFGVVILEAMACGLPVAAYPVTGPKDVITDPKVGALDVDLGAAALTALELNPQDCVAFAQRFAWEKVSEEFLQFLWPMDPEIHERRHRRGWFTREDRSSAASEASIESNKPNKVGPIG